MNLFKKSYRFATYNEKVLKEISKITDQKRLMEIALEAKDIRVADVALDHITDDQYLYEIVNSKNYGNISLEEHALERIKDEEVIRKMMKELSPTHKYIRVVYDKASDPPFEVSIQMNTNKAEENLLRDISKMKYPEDQEKIRLIANKSLLPGVASKAIEMLPYKEESEFLKKLYEKTNSLTIKLSIIKKLQKENQKDILEDLLKNGDESILITKTIARGLDKNNPLLDKEVCPKCGAIDSMYLFDEYRRSIDMNVRGYSCKKCHYEFLEKNGLGELKYPAITLRELIDKK